MDGMAERAAKVGWTGVALVVLISAAAYGLVSAFGQGAVMAIAGVTVGGLVVHIARQV